MTKNWKKITAENFFTFFFWSKTAICLSLGLQKVCPSYRRSLQLSKEAIQHFKTWQFCTFFYFCGSFLPSWIRIRIPNPDPDPQTRLNTDPIRIRIHNPGILHLLSYQAGPCRTNPWLAVLDWPWYSNTYAIWTEAHSRYLPTAYNLNKTATVVVAR